MRLIDKLLLVLLITGSCMTVDRITKFAARVELRWTRPVSYLSDTIRLEYTENQGVMFSLGAELPERLRSWLFTGPVGLILGGMLLFIILKDEVSPGDVAALSLVGGGGFGNLLDRLLYGGAVIDFLTVGIGNIRTAVFNVADVAIIAGAALLIIIHIRSPRID